MVHILTDEQRETVRSLVRAQRLVMLEHRENLEAMGAGMGPDTNNPHLIYITHRIAELTKILKRLS